MPLASRPLIASSLLAVAWIAAAACGRTAYPGLFSNCEGSTGILPVSPKHRLEACATPFVSNPRYSGAPMRLFPTEVQGKTWLAFPAEGFSRPACGVVYRLHDTVECGVPLGGIDTGCIDLETSGLLGYSTIFNTHVPRGGPLNLPVLGLSTGGRTWVLCAKRPEPAWGKTIRRAPICPWSCRSARN